MTHRVFLSLFLAGVVPALYGCGRGSSVAPHAKTTAAESARGLTPSNAPIVPMQITAPLPPSAMAARSAVVAPSSAGRRTQSRDWSWSAIPANASQIAIAQDGTLYALGNGAAPGADQSIWHYIGGGWHNIPGAARQIATSPDGTLWARNAGGSVFHLVGGVWAFIGGNASSITVDRNGNLWATGMDAADGQIWQWTGATWQLHAGSGARLAANPDNSLYVLKANGDIWDIPGLSAAPVKCPGGGGVDITPKPGGTGYYVLAGASGSNFQIWDYTDASPENCTTGSYNATGWLVSSVSFLGNTLAVVANGNVFTTISNALSCPAPSSALGYIPCDLQSAYSLPSATGGVGQTVGIVDAYDNPNAESDMAYYRSTFGLPACTTANGCFRKVSQTGTTSYPAPNASWAGEISLDLDMISAVCPNCHIVLVEATTNSLLNLSLSVDEAVAQGATVVSGSFSAVESSGQLGLDAHYNHPGIPVVVSAGDRGYGARWPAASPYVVAVGGTTLLPSSSLRGWSETAWGYMPNLARSPSFVATGSGCSAYEPKPSWQTDDGCQNRMIADVAAVADLNTGVAVYDTYSSSGWTVYGGTSVAAPIVAGVFALAGNAAGLTPASYVYAHANQLWNITSGTNGPCPGAPPYFCFAGIGYNGPTGLGTPDGLGAFGGASIASAKRAALSAADRTRLANSTVANPAVRAVCPAAAPGFLSCDSVVRLNSGSGRNPPPSRRQPN